MTPTSPARRRRRRTASRRPAPEAGAAATTPVEEPAVAEPAGILEPVIGEPPLAHPPLAEPERAFAARVPPPEPDRPWPSTRRAIFFDVENSSRAEHIARVLDHLKIERGGQRTEAVAVGNWRVIGGDTARLLARHGVQLVHSAPATGVRDWSDLRIAVAAGVWLGGARPGDLIEVVSDDRAFDAVGDVAAMLGVNYRRLSYRALAGLAPAEAEEEVPAQAADTASRRRRRNGRRRHPAAAAEHRAAARPHAAPAPARHPSVEGHTAPHDEIVELVRELSSRSPDGRVLIDTLANALKARGFRRTPGSPRLITRLRRIKELSVSPSGMISLVGGPPPVADVSPPEVEPAAGPVAPEALVPEPAPVPEATAPQRITAEPVPEEGEPAPDRAPAVVAPEAAGAEPAPGSEAAPTERRRRRRGRRGGRGRRRRSQAAPAQSS